MLLALAAPVHADTQQCTDIHVELTPTDYLQIVAWIEDASGHFVDTIYITRKTGLLGLGNRPGRFDFNSGPPPNPATHVDDMWPYGRRITTFPVWAHRHGLTFDKVVFRNGDENNLSHPSGQSSREVLPYCRPTDPDLDPATCGCQDRTIWDTGTCATSAFTDKGQFSPSGETSLYPPRADLVRDPMVDSPSVEMYAAENPFDTISRATPAGGAATDIAYAGTEPKIVPGNYVVYVEVGKEFDFNATYNAQSYPPPCPTCIPWSSYGQPYRGQPSIVYRVPFTVGVSETVAAALDYAGYGDPDGNDGTIRPPDATITTDTPASGAARLELVSDATGMYRLRVRATPQLDFAVPDPPGDLRATQVLPDGGVFGFVAPGDDGQIGTVTSYEVRVRAVDAMTADNFDTSMPTGIAITPAPPGSMQAFQVTGLLPETDYWVGVRAYDDCHNASTLSIVHFQTTARLAGAVDACFVATAAYGSRMANDVEQLRHFRDAVLRRTALGELAVETYYTFGPAVAGVVGSSELLRASARDALAPLVTRVRGLAL